MISHEILGGAEPDEIAAALAPLAGIEVDVVVTARDLGRQATAHWQEEVKLGDTRSFAELRARPAPGRCPGRGAAALLARPGLRRGAAPVGDGGPGRTRAPGRGAAAGRGARRAVAAVRGGVRHQPGGRGRRRCRRRGPGQPLADDRGDRPAAAGQPGARRSAHAARARPARQAGAGGGSAGRPTGYAAADARLPGRRPRAGGRRLGPRDRGERAPRARLARRPDARAGGSRRPAPRRRTSRRPGPGRGRRRGPRSPPASRSPARRLWS